MVLKQIPKDAFEAFIFLAESNNTMAAPIESESIKSKTLI